MNFNQSRVEAKRTVMIMEMNEIKIINPIILISDRRKKLLL